VIAVTLTSGVIFTTVSHARNNVVANAHQSETNINENEIDNSDFTYIPPTKVGDNQPESEENNLPYTGEEPKDTFVPSSTLDLDPNSITVFVNKEYALLREFKPKDLVTVDVRFGLQYYDERTLMRKEPAYALKQLFTEAETDGIILYGVSGYRSYDRQKKIFINNIVNKGKTHTLKYSAVPGTSEHQTGLAIDVSTKQLKYKLTTEFADSREGIWLSNNAHLFGFIIRYPKDKSTITGYAYEPWHIRYVGVDLATYLYENKLTLDEYYQYTPSKDFNFEVLYADMINYIPPKITTTPSEDDGVILDENGEIIEIGDEDDPELNEGDEDLEEDIEKDEPTPTVKPTPTVTPTPPTVTPTPTDSPTPSLSPTEPEEPTVTPLITPTNVPSSITPPPEDYVTPAIDDTNQ
jgi:D-alanyl-D-alanine carboxypeptidase